MDWHGAGGPAVFAILSLGQKLTFELRLCYPRKPVCKAVKGENWLSHPAIPGGVMCE